MKLGGNPFDSRYRFQKFRRQLRRRACLVWKVECRSRPTIRSKGCQYPGELVVLCPRWYRCSLVKPSPTRCLICASIGLTDLENADSARRCGFRSSQQKRASVLDSTNVLIPKLDVAGSTPVSRSIFSITYELLLHSQGLLNALIVVTVHPKSIKLRQVHSVNASIDSCWHSWGVGHQYVVHNLAPSLA